MFWLINYLNLVVNVTFFVGFVIEGSDSIFLANRDWDPSYLKQIMPDDFYDFSKLWKIITSDNELLQASTTIDKYCPVVEDISMDDVTLCEAVEKIKKE